MSDSSIHPHLSEVIGGRQSMRALSITPFIISSKGSHYLTNTRVQKDISNKSGIYRKHMRNNEIYMYQYEAIQYQYKHS
ncbi:hypothetical protein BHE74_00020089 [Ensete ventricosum]|nr:hypothetical protein BHE74_00020089 [Ensete ventricosum]